MIYRLKSGARSFPDDLVPDRNGLVAVGGEVEPDLLIAAYCAGIFPWTGEHPIPWFSPSPRLVLAPGELHVSRSLAQVLRRGDFEVRFDCDFGATIRACAQVPRPGQPGTWIKPNMIRAYSELHARGIVHSVETYRDGELAGGLYGLAFGRGFFGESMFARQSDASKVALVALCERLATRGYHFVDCQQVTSHMESLGAVAISRGDYLERLGVALAFASEHHSWSRDVE